MRARPSAIVNIMSKSMERTVKMSRAELCICTPGDAWHQTSSREVSRADHWLMHPAAHLAGEEGGEFQIHPKNALHKQEMQRLSTVAVHTNTSFMAKAATGTASC